MNVDSGFADASLAYLSANVTQSEASLGGTDNFIGISFTDINLDPHYGWLQFELNSFADGTVGARFVAGHVNNTPDTDSTTGAVPEQGSLVLLAAAGVGLFALRRSRRS